MEQRPPPAELDSIRVVALPAGIDLNSAGHVRAALTSALAAGASVLVADMTATTHCTLEGVHALLSVCRAAETVGARLRLASVQPAVERVLDLTGSRTVLSLYPSLDAARNSEPR
jgi:anti-anti-sigma factor